MTLIVTEVHSDFEVTKGHSDLESHIDLVWPKVTVHDCDQIKFVAIVLDYDPGSQMPCVTEGLSDLVVTVILETEGLSDIQFSNLFKPITRELEEENSVTPREPMLALPF